MTTSVLSPLSMQTFFYENGAAIRPSRLFFYHPDTTDPLTVYTDHLLSVPHDVPVLSGGSGRVPPIYVGETPYRVRVYDSYGALIEDIAWLPGAVAPSEGGEPEPVVETLQTGDFVLSFQQVGTSRTGMVRANGGLIGSPSFAGGGFQVERLNADTEALFKHLWGASTALTVRPSRGASANDDWSANKAIALPDLCGKQLTGMDQMGGPAKGYLGGVTLTPPSTTTPGAIGGSPVRVLTTANLPAHTHGVNDPGHAHYYAVPEDAGAPIVAPGVLAIQSAGGMTYADVTGLTSPGVTNLSLTNTGSGTAFESIDPILLCMVYIKL